MANRESVRHRAVTLIELLVVVAILALLVGLLFGAIQSARLSAARAEAMNDARQILLAAHNFAASNQDKLPNVDGDEPRRGQSVIQALCPYLEADPTVPPAFIRLKSDPSRSEAGMRGPTVGPGGVPYTAPEPTLNTRGQCSFAFNPLIFAVKAKLPSAIPDGTSSSLALTEHYGSCGRDEFPIEFDWSNTGAKCFDGSGNRVPCTSLTPHRATFADYPMYDDVHPVTTVSGGVPVTTGSLPLTFQVRPPLHECDPRIPQSSLPGGILAGFADGSVRFLRPSIEASVFWGAVTPDRQEVVTLD